MRKIKECSIINTDKISEVEQESIARIFLPAIEEYFKDPQVQRNFKIWQKKRNNKVCLG